MAKKKTYLLLVLVICIWGFIAYKIFSTLNPTEQNMEISDFTVEFNPNNPQTVDTFSINPVQRDPFLGTIKKKNTTSVKTSSAEKVKIEWPLITYQGMVKKSDSKNERVFVVTINNKQYLMKLGQTVEEISLQDGSAEEIQIRYKNRSKKVPL
ncbi:MAG TPA: hypothetical protein VFM70_04660 [Salinimicrobium sp.]|nr:hypothetical protein [Salinimicrobium sp.]